MDYTPERVFNAKDLETYKNMIAARFDMTLSKQQRSCKGFAAEAKLKGAISKIKIEHGDATEIAACEKRFYAEHARFPHKTVVSKKASSNLDNIAQYALQTALAAHKCTVHVEQNGGGGV
jgi:hypothetical protein